MLPGLLSLLSKACFADVCRGLAGIPTKLGLSRRLQRNTIEKEDEERLQHIASSDMLLDTTLALSFFKLLVCSTCCATGDA